MVIINHNKKTAIEVL